MRFYFSILLSLLVFFSCQEETEESPSLPSNYGKGMYIVTDQGINYIDYKDTNSVMQQQIFYYVNNSTLSSPKSISIIGVFNILSINNITYTNIMW